ncbi:MAG: DUF1292 domain-containing protein [Clostridia bacterium]|nr:DUF1292 domain-containing protein [Clostridia bacterium]
MKKEKEVKEEVEIGMHVLDILLDEENDEPIVLFDENDKAIRFDQVAIIPLEEKLFAILKPIDELPDVADDEAIVFRIQEEEEIDAQLVVETDEALAMRVFDEYYKLLDALDKEENQNNE